MGVMNVVPYAGPLIGGVVSVFVGIVTPIGGMTVGHTAVVIIGSLLILKDSTTSCCSRRSIRRASRRIRWRFFS